MKRTTTLGTLAVAAALAGFFVFHCSGCASPRVPQQRGVDLSSVEDVVEGAGLAADLAGGLPAVFVVGGASDLEALLRLRSGLEAAHPGARVATLIDASRTDDLARTSLADQLLEPALDGGGPLLIDGSGATARSLADGRPGSWLVAVTAEARVSFLHAADPASLDELAPAFAAPGE